MKYKDFTPSVEEIKEQVDFFDFYLSEQHLSHFKSRTKDWVVAGICPFHEDKTPGSFTVNTRTGAFCCFSCGTKGDIINYIKKKYDLLFLDALYKLKKEWGAQ